MKVAMLIQCHCLPEQINAMVDILKCEEITFFIHVDKKSDIKNEILKNKNIIFVSDDERVDVKWAQISQVDATLALLRAAMAHQTYDYFWLCSGQDFPIKNKDEILSFFRANKGKEFINLFDSKSISGVSNNYDKRNEITYCNFLLNKSKWSRLLRRSYVQLSGGYRHTFSIFKRKNTIGMDFYFGSQWWCLSYNMISWIMNYLNGNSNYREFFTKSVCSDECFFQTLVMNSPYSGNRAEYLHYIDWTGCKNSPKELSVLDFDSIMNSKYLIARKCNIKTDGGLVNKIISALSKA